MVSLGFVRYQWPMIATLGAAAGGVLKQKLTRHAGSGVAPVLPGPLVRTTLPPRADALVKAYVRHVGGDPAGYRGTVPAHLFPQWAFSQAAAVMRGVPYPMADMLNAGCRMEIRRPIPAGEPLVLTAQLTAIDDDGRRAVLHTRLVTGTASAPEALVVDMQALCRLKGSGDNHKGGKDAGKPGKEQKPTVPVGAREIARFRLGARAGLDFALLTGDFNPIHWIPPAAKAAGFRNTILHGFASLGRAIEAMNRVLWAGDTGHLQMIEVRFVRPLVLPATVGVYVGEFHSPGSRAEARPSGEFAEGPAMPGCPRIENTVTVGDAPGGAAYMTGSFR